jgi:hypothetical protein
MYLDGEKKCALQTEGNTPGLYQFGVPTEMAATIPILKTLGVEYSTYYGFDSFQGVPQEALRKSKVPPGGVWSPGAFSEIYRQNPAFKTVREKRTGKQHYLPREGFSDAKPLSVAEAAESWRQQLHASENKITLVPGFYNESLTSDLARDAPPALYVDINCDLYVSSLQALDWLFKHRIARQGTLISYDDWY